MDIQSLKIKQPKRKYLRTKNHVSALLSVSLGILVVFTAPTEVTAFSTIHQYRDRQGTMVIEELVIKDWKPEGPIVNSKFIDPMLCKSTTEQINPSELTNPGVHPYSSPDHPAASSVPLPQKMSATGSLVFTVEMMEAADDSAFSLAVELDDDSINGLYGDVFFVNGKADIKIRQGETKTAWDVPVGTAYIVRISTSLPYAFQVGKNGTSVAAGKIEMNTISEVAFHAYYSDKEEEAGTPEETERPNDPEKPETNPVLPSEDYDKEKVIEDETNNSNPSEMPSDGQSVQDKDIEEGAATHLYMWLCFIIAVLVITLTIQMVRIQSDLRVLRWYRFKKARLLNKDTPH